MRQNSPGFVSALAAATEVWKNYLEGKATGLGLHPIWFTILDGAVAEKVNAAMQDPALGGTGAAPVVNRYFANWMGCEIVTYETHGFAIVWAKTGSWLIVGVATMPDRTDCASVELSPTGGAFPSVGHAVPPIVLATFGHQTREYVKRLSQMSPTQRQKISDDFKKNAARIPGSKQNLAMQEDMKMFGDAAWVELPKSDAE